jgi:hypothetical protein
MAARRKARRPREPENDREFDKLLRVVSRMQSVSRPLPRTNSARGTGGKPRGGKPRE